MRLVRFPGFVIRATAACRSIGRTRIPLSQLLLVLACADGAPTAPDAAVEPSAYLEPELGARCDEQCLRGDIVGGWEVTGNPAIGTHITLRGVESPTTRGSSVSATYCLHRALDGDPYLCEVPRSWWKGHAGQPDGRVHIIGYDRHGQQQRVRFTGYAPRPTIELLEYDRPDAIQCGAGSFKCTGPYRLKVEVRNSDWYGHDRITLIGMNADGAWWPLPDTYVHVGNTFEWTWDNAWPGTPGSRIIAIYQPWRGSSDWQMELSVPLSDQSPPLALHASEAPVVGPDGPMAVQAEPGASVVFTPSAPGASLIEVFDWEWLPETAEGAHTNACAAGENPCTTNVYENGTMRVTARVDGQTRQATVGVTVQAAELLVACEPASVVRGENITCTARVEPEGVPFEVQEWHFEGGGYERSSSLPTVVWQGTAVVGGRVSVNALVDGEEATAEAFYEVLDRDWSNVDVAANAVEVESLLPIHPEKLHDLGGIDHGYIVDPAVGPIEIVPTGPNNSIAFWTAMPVRVEAKIQVNRAALRERSSFWYGQLERRPAFSRLRMCTRADVEPFVDAILRHEGIDLNARSHAGLYYAVIRDNAWRVVEDVTTEVSPQDLVDLTRTRMEPVHSEANEASGAADDDFAEDHCTYDYDYPIRRQNAAD